MKWMKYSQIVYLLAGIAFLISGTIKFFNKQEYGLQLVIGVSWLVMFFVRKFLMKKMQNNQNNQNNQ